MKSIERGGLVSAMEALILGLLLKKGDGAFGSELVNMSDGRLKRGSAYPLLGRLERAGLVEAERDPGTDTYALARTRYTVTARGVQARADFAEFVGLIVPVTGRLEVPISETTTWRAT